MEHGTFTSQLTSTDWGEEWKALQKARRKADDAAVWDEKAKTFPIAHGEQTSYVQRFLELAGVQPGETVLDMGCGTGALATPLAQAGCRVIACDFSQGMLDVMRADQRELGVTGVETHLMSWADNWDEFGLAEKSVDVALASRSIVTDDLKASLLKLDRVARRRACITLPCGPSPKTDERLLAAAGLSQQLGRDFLYAFNILATMGINPELSYIPSVRIETFPTLEDAQEGFSKIVREAAKHMVCEEEMDAALARLCTWLASNLVEDEHGFHLSEERKVTWAFIAWTPLR